MKQSPTAFRLSGIVCKNGQPLCAFSYLTQNSRNSRKESGPASPPPKQVFCPLVIPFGHVQGKAHVVRVREKRGIEGVRRIEGVFFFHLLKKIINE